jgi:hypothetical protein
MYKSIVYQYERTYNKDTEEFEINDYPLKTFTGRNAAEVANDALEYKNKITDVRVDSYGKDSLDYLWYTAENED